VTDVVLERRPYAILDRPSRLLKAEKIARIVGGPEALRGARVLDIGCGSGYIAEALADLVGPEGRVHAVDVRDQRLVEEGYDFRQVDGTTLPYADESLDVVLSNHVIEHVGEEVDQLHHLQEVRRVLRPGGLCYLAVPSRWVLVEPHVRLPLLSWLPRAVRSPYVRLARRGAFYDCDLPTRGRLRRLYAAAGLEATERTLDALLEVGRLETPSRAAGLALSAPAPLRRALLPLSPTLVYLLRRPL
jgi:ubiquinone/menaquinone biosynthesis C-methylase UbiE